MMRLLLVLIVNSSEFHNMSKGVIPREWQLTFEMYRDCVHEKRAYAQNYRQHISGTEIFDVGYTVNDNLKV